MAPKGASARRIRRGVIFEHLYVAPEFEAELVKIWERGAGNEAGRAERVGHSVFPRELI